MRTPDSDSIHTLDVDSHGNAYLASRPLGSAGDTPLVLYAMAPGPKNTSLELSGAPNSAGNLLMRNESGQGVILRGSQENASFLAATAGSNQYYGGEKNDGLYSGRDNDELDGGNGDDDYYFAEIHGEDIVTDSGGENTLHFTATGLKLEDIALSVEGNDLEIRAKGHQSNLVRINAWQGKIKGITVGHWSLEGANITPLAEAMNSFTAVDLSSHYPPGVEETMQRYWVTLHDDGTQFRMPATRNSS